MQKTSTRSIFLFTIVSFAMVFGYTNTNCSWFRNSTQPHKIFWRNFQIGISRTTRYNNEDLVWIVVPTIGIIAAGIAAVACLDIIENNKTRKLNSEEKTYEKAVKKDDEAEELSEQARVIISEIEEMS